MRSLLTIMFVIEAFAGVALIAAPSQAVSVVISIPLGGTGSLPIARIAGAALLSLAIACWLSRDTGNQAVVWAMLSYNLSVAVLLLNYTVVVGTLVIVLMLAAVLHIGLGAWCILALRNYQSSRITNQTKS